MSAIRFVDCTLRDGPLSLWASAMTTAMMRIAPSIVGIVISTCSTPSCGKG